MKKLLCTILTGVVLTTAVVTPVSNAYASSIYQSEIGMESLSLEEEALANDLEVLFDQALTLENDKYIVNEEVVINYFGEESLPSIEAFAKTLNGEELVANDLIDVPDVDAFAGADDGMVVMAKSSWAKCVGNKVIDATGIGFISGGMWKLIEKKNWSLLAKELAKVVGKNALKGGAVGFAASLAWYGVKCR
ncbi:hypothetical protein ACTHQ4_20860 [Alkalicoccobacillus gibsonii]|uniref:hypothetical protein n=1 Tax=Alkalicoccobacillus gibsonii TaxID=79881 RepID=UPI003F7BC5D0